MQGRQVGQWHPPGDVDAQLAGVDQCHQLRQLGGVAVDEEVDAAHAAFLVGRSGHPHRRVHHDTAVADHTCQRGQLRRIDRREVEHDVGRLSQFGKAVAEKLIGAGRLDTLTAARPGRGDHVGAGVLGQLYGVAADRATRAVDQHALAGAQPGVVEKGLPGGEADQRQPGGIGQRNARGRPRQDSSRREDVFRGRAGAGHRQESDHTVTDLDAVRVLAQRVDRAGDVDAGGVRQSHRDGALHEAGTDVAVDRVERCRSHPDPDLSDAGDRLFHLLVAQDVRGAVPVETHCLHGMPQLSQCGKRTDSDLNQLWLEHASTSKRCSEV